MKANFRFLTFLLLGLTLLAGPASAKLEKQMEEHLVPPDVLMRHAEAIELSEEQRQKITAAISQMQADATEIQWQVQAASKRLLESLAPSRVDFSQVENNARIVMELEQKIKLRHLKLLVTIKNELSLEQLDRIQELKKR